MATNKLVNGPVEINSGELSLFGVTGYVGSKDKWVMNVFFGVRAEVDPAPASPDIEECIKTDFKAGNGEKIEVSHSVITRDVFAKGAVRATEFLAGKKSGLYNMQDVLGLRA